MARAPPIVSSVPIHKPAIPAMRNTKSIGAIDYQQLTSRTAKIIAGLCE
jgi:hypothetical protein